MDIWRTTVPNSNMSSGGGRECLVGLNPEWLNHLWPGILGSVTLVEDLRDWVHEGWVPSYNNTLAFIRQLRKITDYHSQVQVSKNGRNPWLVIDVVSKMWSLQILVNFLANVYVPKCISQNVQTDTDSKCGCVQWTTRHGIHYPSKDEWAAQIAERSFWWTDHFYSGEDFMNPVYLLPDLYWDNSAV